MPTSFSASRSRNPVINEIRVVAMASWSAWGRVEMSLDSATVISTPLTHGQLGLISDEHAIFRPCPTRRKSRQNRQRNRSGDLGQRQQCGIILAGPGPHKALLAGADTGLAVGVDCEIG